MPTSERRTLSRHCHFPNKEWLSLGSSTFYGYIHLHLGARQLLLTAQQAALRDYDSAAVSLGSIKGARLSGRGIDGSYELLAREESNIAEIHD